MYLSLCSSNHNGTVAECHFGYNCHISVKTVSKLFGLSKCKQKSLFTNFVSKFRKFRSKSTFGDSLLIILWIKFIKQCEEIRFFTICSGLEYNVLTILLSIWYY